MRGGIDGGVRVCQKGRGPRRLGARVNPQAMRELYCTGKKTDRIDAKKLADRLKRHMEDADADDGFPEVWVPDEATQELRKLLSHYDFIRRDLVSTKNRLALFQK